MPLQDLRHALRMAARQPGFTLAAVLSLAIGIGANATMFGLVDILLLRPPPHVREPDGVVRVYRHFTVPGFGQVSSDTYNYPDYLAFRSAAGALAQTAALGFGELTLGRGSGAEKVEARYVSASFFPLLGVQPALGRFFGADEDRVAADASAVVVSHEFWKRRLNGAPDVLGREVRLGNARYTVVGVAPPAFTGVDLSAVDVWLPLTAAVPPEERARVFGTRQHSWLLVVGRLREGVTREGARARLESAFRRAQAEPGDAGGARDRISLGPVLRARGPEAPQEARLSLWLAAVSLVVLLIACANVANLLLTRGVHRRREIAVRLALGVGRGRLVRHLVTESVLLALLGAAGGLLLAAWAGSAIHLLLVPDLPALAGVVDERVLGFTALTAVATGLLCGLLPALQASRPDLTVALKAGARDGSAGRSHLKNALLVGQVALSLVLLIGAGLFARSLRNVRGVELGMDTGRVLMARVDLRDAGYTPARTAELYQRLHARAGSLPGVEEAGLAVSIPFRSNVATGVSVPGRDSIPRHSLGGPYVDAVTPDLFAALGMELRTGRGLTAADGPGAPPVAVVNETMARWLWPDGEAVGKCFRSGAEKGVCREVVGVAKDARQQGVVVEPTLQFFVPLAQAPELSSDRVLFMRTREDPERVAGAVRRALQSVSADLPHVEVRPLRELADAQLQVWRLGASLFGLFGLVALALALVGLYGVLAFHVSQRTHEIGVRLALGAPGTDVVRLFVAHGLRLTLAGVLIGGAAALGGARLLASLLYGVTPTDPVTFASVAALLVATALAASYLPARRATRVDPMVALRSE